MGNCTSCTHSLAKNCPLCDRRFVGTADICGHCAAAGLTVDSPPVKEAEIVEDVKVAVVEEPKEITLDTKEVVEEKPKKKATKRVAKKAKKKTTKK